jgi:hypothetical protein
MPRRSQQTDSRNSRAVRVLETSGEVFPDGTMLELAPDPSCSGKLGLVHWDGKIGRFRHSVEAAGYIYKPAAVSPTTLSAISFFSETKDFGSASLLYSKIIGVLKKFFALPTRDLNLVACWLLCSWFPDVLPIVPTLLVSGPSPSHASSFLRLLKVLCRRGILLAELNVASFRALPMRLQPTLLIDQTVLNRPLSGLLRAASNRGVYVAHSGEFLDLHCAKAIFAAESELDAAMAETMLSVAVVPSESGSARLSEGIEHEIAAEFQPLLLRYRFLNHRAVSESKFDIPQFTPGLRDLARSLGAAVVDDADLTARIATLLAPQDAAVRAQNTLLPEVGIVTAALALIHEREKQQVLVKELTQFVNVVLRAGGEIFEYSPEEIGWRLTKLGLFTRRIAGGKGIRVDREFTRAVHDLARRFGVEKSPDRFPTCPDCNCASKSADSKRVM